MAELRFDGRMVAEEIDMIRLMSAPLFLGDAGEHAWHDFAITGVNV